MNLTPLFVCVEYRIINHATGIPFTELDRTIIEHTFVGPVEFSEKTMVADMFQVEETVRNMLTDMFWVKLRSDSELRAKVGASEWSIHFNVPIIDSPLHLSRGAAVNSLMFKDAWDKQYNGQEGLFARNNTMIKRCVVDMSQEKIVKPVSFLNKILNLFRIPTTKSVN